MSSMIQCVMDSLGMGEGSVKKKTWMELKTEVSELRRELACSSVSVPSSISFRTLSDGRERIYFLCSPRLGWEVTLLYVDILPADKNRFLQWHSLVEPSVMLPGAVRFTKEEQLQWERKRLATWGISSYELHIPTGGLIFPAAASLYQCIDTGFGSGILSPAKLRSCPAGAKLSPQICPSNGNLIAYVTFDDLWVTATTSGATERLTFCSINRDDPLSAGNPCYVMQEEFNRYIGFWWQPVLDSPNTYRILYEEVDESEVVTLPFPCVGGIETEEMRFPRAGSPNAKSELRIVEFKLTESQQIIDVQSLNLRASLADIFPWAEYMVRAGWLPSATHVWLQMLDRRQRRLDLIFIPVEEFVSLNNMEMSDGVSWMTRFHVILSISSEVWINVHDLLVFLPSQEGSPHGSLIFANEETGFRHLYLVNYNLDSALCPTSSTDTFNGTAIGRKVALTCGEWPVVGKSIWFDIKRHLVYFLALRETPLEKHLYVTSLKRPGEIKLLSTLGYSHSVSMNPDCSFLVMISSNVSTLPACQAFRITQLSDGIEGVMLEPAGFLIESRPAQEMYCPDLHSHTISDDVVLYAMVLKPHKFEYGRKYPTVVIIYGGPEVQLVSNTFKGMRQLRMHMLAAQGYCVVAIDSRGSQHRGLAFESHIKNRMGTVELEDQIEFLRHLAHSLGYIDLSRVAIHGWSYGGYLSLMALSHYPYIFKIAIAGAPVTCWHLYDTAYTERYMDLPELNPMGYSRGSVLKYVKLFPEEENRLLIIHGLIDENVHFVHTREFVSALIKEGKPYQLQVYPNERHSLRNMDASKHYETMLLSFLQNYL